MAGGRPRTDTTTRRDCVVSVRLSDAERAALDARAATAGLPVPDFARAALVSAAVPARRRRKADGAGVLSAAELRELNMIGVNIHQIVRHLNYGTRGPINDDLEAALAALQSFLAKALP